MQRITPSQLLIVIFLTMLLIPASRQTIREARQGGVPRVFEVFRQRPTPQNLRAFEKALQDESVTAGELRPWVQAAQLLLLRDAGEKALVGRDGWLFYQPGVSFLTQRPSRQDATVAQALSAVNQFRDLLAARGIRLLLLPVPNKESIYPEKLSSVARTGAPIIGRDTRQFLSGCQAARIEYIDLFDLFDRGRRLSTVPLYLVQDSHWSPAGLLLAAAAVAERVNALSPNAGGEGETTAASAGFDRRPTPVQRFGDLVRMLRSPPLERRLPAERSLCSKVFHHGTERAYADMPEADVVVIGDSFLRIYERDEPGSAGFIAHLAAALGRPVASIVNDGGASTLVRQDLARRAHLLNRAKVVVWEFTERDLRLGTEGWQSVTLPPVRRERASISSL
ncbi:MAG: hypothetical protein U1G07_05050 [Verrucomicrobiota bacterium]